MKALTDQLKALENRYQEWLMKQENELISLESITDYLHYYRRCLQDPSLSKQVVEKFVDRVIIKTDTIEVFFKVSVVSIGGGGPLVDVCTVRNSPFISLYYTDPRP